MSEILNEINQLKNLDGKICLKNGQISTFEKSLHLNLFADFIPDDKTVEDIESFILSKLPKSFKSVKCSVKKIVSEKRFVLDAVKEYLLVSHKAIASLIDGTRSVFSKDGYNASVKLYVETSAYVLYDISQLDVVKYKTFFIPSACVISIYIFDFCNAVV